MKKFLIALLFGAACSVSGEQIASKGNRIILDESCSNIWLDIEWVPSNEQTEKAVTALGQFLNDDEALKKSSERLAGEVLKIREHFGEYRVQFSGVIEDGKKYIHCNFFPAVRSFPDWEHQYVCVFDSGFWYWNILYDPLTGELSRFQINGYT